MNVSVARMTNGGFVVVVIIEAGEVPAWALIDDEGVAYPLDDEHARDALLQGSARGMPEFAGIVTAANVSRGM